MNSSSKGQAGGVLTPVAPKAVWLIHYDDAEVRPEIVIGEAAARARFQRISDNWNAHLFVKVESNSRDDRYANANIDLTRPTPAAAAAPSDPQNPPIGPSCCGGRPDCDAREECAAAELVAASPAAAAEMSTSAGIGLQTGNAADQMSTSVGAAAAAGVPTDLHQLLDAINWLMGCDDFEKPEGAKGNYWWRSEFASKAGLVFFARRYWLAASPVAPAGAPTLTDEQILHLWDTHVNEPNAKYPLVDADKVAFARAVLLSAGSQGEQHGPSHPAAPQSSVPSASPRSSLPETDESALPQSSKEQK